MTSHKEIKGGHQRQTRKEEADHAEYISIGTMPMGSVVLLSC